MGQISGNLGRLGSDPTKAVLNLTVDYMPSKWQREFSLRNDGSSGTGQWRNMGTFVKTDILKKGDTFIGMVEINNDQDIEIGSQLRPNFNILIIINLYHSNKCVTFF